MRSGKWIVACTCVITAVALTGCKDADKSPPPQAAKSKKQSGETPSAHTYTGVEKVKPAPGTGNVQGKVLYNGKPAENIEVRLCEKFSRFGGGCGGKTFMAKTDTNGEYVIADVPPQSYEGLLARVFNTDSFIFAAKGLVGLDKVTYAVAENKTLFVPQTNLFKNDLKLVHPKAGAKVGLEKLELKWDPYPDAAYYKFSVRAEETGVTSPYTNERIDGTSYGIDKPLPKGTYRWQVTAYNGENQKLSESSNDIKFTVVDGSGS